MMDDGEGGLSLRLTLVPKEQMDDVSTELMAVSDERRGNETT